MTTSRKTPIYAVAFTLAALAACSGERTPSITASGAVLEPIPGLACGWEGNPCVLPEIVVTASRTNVDGGGDAGHRPVLARQARAVRRVTS